MFGDRNTHYSDEYYIRRQFYLLQPLSSLPQYVVILIGLIALSTALLLSYTYLRLPFWPPGQSDVIAAGGCLNLDGSSSDTGRRATLETVEADIREQLEEDGIATSDPTDDSLPYIGEVYWSKYGYWSGYDTVPRWIVVFKNEYDDRWHYRNFVRNPEVRVTALYMAGNRNVVDYCTRPQP
ncbi:MAG: hypothetical protein EA415_12745 [Sphaerobacteraceae bacterium]|nr:MAG: hypothetical protein EA415_12745 [Sphaerobacteraceae bacterium]